MHCVKCPPLASPLCPSSSLTTDVLHLLLCLAGQWKRGDVISTRVQVYYLCVLAIEPKTYEDLFFCLGICVLLSLASASHLRRYDLWTLPTRIVQYYALSLHSLPSFLLAHLICIVTLSMNGPRALCLSLCVCVVSSLINTHTLVWCFGYLCISSFHQFSHYLAECFPCGQCSNRNVFVFLSLYVVSCQLTSKPEPTIYSAHHLNRWTRTATVYTTMYARRPALQEHLDHFRSSPARSRVPTTIVKLVSESFFFVFLPLVLFLILL